MKSFQYFVLAVLSATLAVAQTQTTSTQTTTKKTTVTHKRRAAASSTAVTKADLQALKDMIATQQQQIQELQQQVQQRDAAVQQVQQQLTQTQSTASDAQTKAQSAAESAKAVPALQSEVADLKTNATSTAQTLQETQKQVNESPVAIHFKGITLTPGGFVAAETSYRTRALSADVNTPFNSVPFSGSSQAHVTEFNASGRQSRLSLLAEGKVSSAKIGAYYEADFLSAGTNSNNNQSNRYVMSQRQLFAQGAFNNGWTFTGGQMWSLVAEDRKGLDNRSEALPMTIDAQYNVGFSWARQYGFRVAKNFDNKVWLGFSVEDPQTTFTVHGAANNFLIGAPGVGGGLLDSLANYSFNKAPDFVVKAALEPGFGHYEIFGVVGTFRDRFFPCATTTAKATCNGVVGPSAAGATNDSLGSGGIGANARVSFFNKHVDLGGHFFGGNGTGRYGSGGLTDATIRPDGKLALIRNYQALGTLEYHAAKFDVYSNVGGEYDSRVAFLNAAGKAVGYGAPLFANFGCSTETLPGTTTPAGTTGGAGTIPGSLANCTGDTRNLIEGTLGFWYRFYKGPKGTVQWGAQYSYVARNTWFGTGMIKGTAAQPYGNENMVFTSFRYYIP